MRPADADYRVFELGQEDSRRAEFRALLDQQVETGTLAAGDDESKSILRGRLGDPFRYSNGYGGSPRSAAESFVSGLGLNFERAPSVLPRTVEELDLGTRAQPEALKGMASLALGKPVEALDDLGLEKTRDLHGGIITRAWRRRSH